MDWPAEVMASQLAQEWEALLHAFSTVLALTAWLMNRFQIRLGDVIGHNESLTSRFHKELYAGWRCQTHGDFVRADMNVYRSQLATLAKRLGVPTGGAVRRVTPRC